METGEILLVAGLGLGAWYLIGRQSPDGSGGSIFSSGPSGGGGVGGGGIGGIPPDTRAGPDVLGPSTPNTTPGGDTTPSTPDHIVVPPPLDLTGDTRKVVVRSGDEGPYGFGGPGHPATSGSPLGTVNIPTTVTPSVRRTIVRF